MTGPEMNSTSSKLDSCRAATHWLAIASCLPVVLLGGCRGFQRCEIWDRVTHPDYMQQEHTTLHGYHRTSWDSWPEEWNHLGWSQRVPAESAEALREQEELPTGDSAQELPVPESDGSAPETSEQTSVPQSRSRKSRSSNAEPRRLDRTQKSAGARSIAGIEVDAEAMALSVESPLMLDSAPAPWTNRFTSLIASDRKARWRELSSGQLEERTEEPAPVEDVAPLVPASHETLESAATEQESTVQTQTETTVDQAPPPIPSGDGAVQFRVVPANDAAVNPEDEAPQDDTAGSSVGAVPD